MIEKLDAMHEDFVKQKDDEKYKWCARLRKYLAKNQELKSEYHHPLFIEIIEFHIGQLQRERDLLQKFLTDYEDRKLEEISYQPERYLKKSYEVSETIAMRIRELDGYIDEYTADLNKRKRDH